MAPRKGGLIRIKSYRIRIVIPTFQIHADQIRVFDSTCEHSFVSFNTKNSKI